MAAASRRAWPSTRVARLRRAAVFVTLLALGPGSAVAAAPATGVLEQKPGRAGCISDDGTRGACTKGRALEKALQIAISPDGTSAYVASPIEGLAVLDRAASSGVLTQKAGRAGCFSDLVEGCRSAPGTDALYAVAVSPDAKSVYTAGLDGVAILDRDPLTGRLTPKAGRAGCVDRRPAESGCARSPTIDFPETIAVSPDGANVYVGSLLSEALTIFDRDASGALRQKDGREGCVSVSGTRGRCVRGGFRDIRAVTISPDGRSLYVVSSEGLTVFDRNPVGGPLRRKPGRQGCVTESGSRGRCANGKALRGAQLAAVSPDGETVYVVAERSGAVAVLDRDVATGAVTQLRGRAGCVSDSGTGGRCANGKALKGAGSVAISPDGRTVYVAGKDSVAILDRDGASGALRQKRGREGCVSEFETRGVCADGKALRDAEWVSASSDGRNVYVAAGRSSAVAAFDRR